MWITEHTAFLYFTAIALDGFGGSGQSSLVNLNPYFPGVSTPLQSFMPISSISSEMAVSWDMNTFLFALSLVILAPRATSMLTLSGRSYFSCSRLHSWSAMSLHILG